MSEDFDVEAMLEAPFNKEGERKRSGSHEDKKRRKRSRSRSRDRKRDRDRDRDKKRKGSERRSKSRDKRSRSRDRDRRRRSREKERRRSRSPIRKRRSRSKERRRPRSISKSPVRETLPELTPEERDARTIFCMQLSARIRPRDLEEFFSSVGKVRDVRLITDNKTRRSKGIAYVEFAETDSVPLAMGLNNQKLLGVPIIVQSSQAEKNRTASSTSLMQKGTSGPMRLYVGSLHFNITEDMLRGIFAPFGEIDDIKLIRDHETGRSQGYGFMSFTDAEDAKKALEQLNGFELAGRPMKVGHVTERTAESQGASILDSDEMDRAGIDLGATGRLQLMAKLAEGTGFQIPQYAANALNQAGTAPGATLTAAVANAAGSAAAPTTQAPAAGSGAPPIATQCFMLSNMFDPNTETRSSWDQEIRDDVIEECNKHGGVLHIYVDKASPQGNVYVKCPSIAAAVASVNSLHGRYFAGRVITAAYVPLPNYHALFSDAVRANHLLMPSAQALQAAGFSGFMSGVPQQVIR
ncbi:RNA-binding protein 39-like isoform X2 [Haliotis asinina]|uniref:RNA-binding protein 39-like isoform X2 n=1 Tax=Haliotis asinina TaxID=109174 RepID=UPI00353256AF